MKKIKNMWDKIKTDLDKRTDPDAPVLTGGMVERFILRLLLITLSYMVINTFIVKLAIWQFLFIDMLLYVIETFIKFVNGRKK